MVLIQFLPLFLITTCHLLLVLLLPLYSISIPKTIHEAISHPHWHNAMIQEMNALDDNGTWNLVKLPLGK